MAKKTERTLKLSAQGIEKANTALTKFGSVADLAAQIGAARKRTKGASPKTTVGMSRGTIYKFLNGEPVQRKEFHEICKKLGLKWQESVDLPGINQPESAEKEQEQGTDIDELVREVRSLYHSKIQFNCGQIQFLNRQVPIDDLYTKVYILEDTPKLRSLNISERMQGFDPIADNPNSFYLGKVRGERVPGLDMVTDGCKVMCLGAPGSGKTTYLYYVAIQCNKGELQANRVPIFIRLIEFTDTIKNQPELSLLNYIKNLFHTEGVEQPQAIETIITQGRVLILLDGLDEVPKNFSKLVLSRIREFCKYHKNSIIITCRTNALDYNFSDLKFTQVIVADFEQPQIEIFANKWFVAGAKNDKQAGEARAKEFIEKLGLPEHKRIRDLAVTPILLNLTCLIFKNNLGEFPKNRSELYQRGINILLEEWDAERGIERDEVYGKLDLERRKALLTHVAKVSFEENCYFFKQEEIEKYIADYLRTLPHAQIDSLQRDSRAVLKSIEVQHGLLMERAPEIYSFSHLTFQEYFTAKWFCDHCDRDDWQGLASHIRKKYWREVFLLAASMMQSANELVKELKKEVDAITAKDKGLQQLLTKVKHKSNSVIANYKSAAIRAFYFDLALIRIIHIDSLDEKLDFGWFYAAGSDWVTVLGLGFDLAYFFDNNLAVCFDFGFISLDPIQSYAGDVFRFSELNLDNELAIDFALKTAWIITFTFGLDYANHLPKADLIKAFSVLIKALILATEKTENKKLKQSLQELRMPLPDNKKNRNKIRDWYRVKGQGWAEQLKAAMMTHREMDFTWQYDQQRELLRPYYDANQLLVDCLNNDCKVSNEVREEIEETLLLPIAEIEKRQQQM